MGRRGGVMRWLILALVIGALYVAAFWWTFYSGRD